MRDIGRCHAPPCCYSVDGHPLPIDELKGIKAVESIDLSGKNLGSVSAIIIGACIAGNAHLRKLKCALPPNRATLGDVTLFTTWHTLHCPFRCIATLVLS